MATISCQLGLMCVLSSSRLNPGSVRVMLNTRYEEGRLSLQTGGEGQDPRSRKYSVKKPETMTSLLADTFRLT